MSKLYRFALVGLARSGKTCILTALTLPRMPSPDGYSATWVQHPPEANVSDEAIRKAYADGDDVLRRAHERLEEHLLPDKSIVPAMRFRFDFKVKEGRTYATELIDYPGELLNPEWKDNQAADSLRDMLNDFDGLLVLAEAPHPDEDRQDALKAITRLDQALARLNSQRKKNGPLPRKPVVLLLNKWDRQEAEPQDPGTRKLRLQAFLEESHAPTHRALVNSLQGAVAPDCFHLLAVSAFGASRRQTLRDAQGKLKTDELPPGIVPLPSFGLEDGFIWAARKCDVIEMEAYRQEAQANAHVWRPWLPLALNRIRDRGRRLIERFPEHSPEHQELKLQNRRLDGIARGRQASFALVLLIGIAFTFGAVTRYIDVRTIRDVEARLKSPDARDDELAQDAGWLEGYLRSPGGRHRVSKWAQNDGSILDLLARVNDRREDLAMAPIRTASDPQTVADYGRIYLERFPNGKRREEVTEILARAEATAKDIYNWAHLQTIAEKLPGFAAKTPLKEHDFQVLERVNSDIEALPYPKSVSERVQTEKERIHDEIGKHLMRAGAQIFDAQLEQHLSAGNLGAACLLVRATPSKSERRESSVDKIWTVADAAFAASLRKEHWEKCHVVLNDMQQGFVDSGLASKERLATLQKWKSQTRLGEDRKFYEQVRKYQNRDCCKTYLSKAPLGRMAAKVQAYLNYLQSLDEPMELTFHFYKFSMGNRPSTVYRLETFVEMSCNETKIVYRTREKFAANTTHEREFHKEPFTAKLSDAVKVRFYMENGGIFGNEAFGEKEWFGTVHEMKELGIEAPIPGRNSSSEVFIRLEGIPQAPPLPQYVEEGESSP